MHARDRQEVGFAVNDDSFKCILTGIGMIREVEANIERRLIGCGQPCRFVRRQSKDLQEGIVIAQPESRLEVNLGGAGDRVQRYGREQHQLTQPATRQSTATLQGLSPRGPPVRLHAILIDTLAQNARAVNTSFRLGKSPYRVAILPVLGSLVRDISGGYIVATLTREDVVRLCPGIQAHDVLEVMNTRASVAELEAALLLLQDADEGLAEMQREHGDRINRLLAILRRSEISLPEMEP